MKLPLGFVFVLALALSAAAQPGPAVLWTRTFGGPWDDVTASMIRVREHGVLIAGSSVQENDTTNYLCAYLVRLNMAGGTLWTNLYGQPGMSLAPLFHSLVQTLDGGFITTTQGDCTAVWYSNMGRVTRSARFIGDWYYASAHYGHIVRVLRPTVLGDFVGHEEGWGINESNHYTWLIYYDTQLNRGILNSASNTAPRSWEITGLADSSVICLAAGWEGWPNSEDANVLHLRRPGSTSFGHLCRGHTWRGGRIVMNAAGEYFIASQRYPESEQVAVTKLSTTGDSLWTQFVEDSTWANVNDACATPDGGVAVLCTHENSNGFWLLKFDNWGNLAWQQSYLTNDDHIACALVYDGYGSYVIAGTERIGGADRNIVVLRTYTDWSLDTPEKMTAQPEELILHAAYPNPFNARTEIVFDLPRAADVSLKVYDVLGRPVATLREERLTAGVQRVAFDGRDLPTGVYFCRLTAGGETRTQKLLLLK